MKQTTRTILILTTTILFTIAVALVAQHFLGKAGCQKIDLDAIRNLSDEEISIEVADILDLRYGFLEDEQMALSAMSETEQTVKTLAEFDLEYTDGGLAQYFTNPSRDTAPYLIESLRTINAPNMANAIEEYVATQKIDMEDPLEFHYDSQKLLEWELELYGVDAINNKLYSLIEQEHFHKKMIAYIRYNLEELVYGEDNE